jgi:biopolymer transport protein ExbD
MARIHKTIMEPRSNRRYRFALTPLADAMFQLLIFFMFSSGMSSYSLLRIHGGAGEGDPGTATELPAPDQAQILADETAIWTIESGEIIVSGQRFGFDLLPEFAAALNATGAANVVLIVRPTAEVQDLTTVLESLAAAGITAVQVAAAEGS